MMAHEPGDRFWTMAEAWVAVLTWLKGRGKRAA
jgi:hypothetical protein